MKKKFALISVYNKYRIKHLCEVFAKYRINLLATESTSQHIKQLGYKCELISKYTNFKEILDGKVKTLHPLIYASIMYDRNNTKQTKYFKKLNFPNISFVIVNLYPFKKYKAIKMIDVGGPTLLRASAKNYKSVTSLCDTNDYYEFIINLKKNNGKTSLAFRKKMALKVFKYISNYDRCIAGWIDNKKIDINYSELDKKKLRYGENPHQKAFYINNSNKNYLVDSCIKKGKGISYNNILDVESAFNCVSDFQETTCAIVKHTNACGVSSNKNIYTAFKNAIQCDPISSYGGVVAFNKVIDQKLAKIMKKNFFEIIIAKRFTKEAIKVLEINKNLILIETKKINNNSQYEIRSVYNNFLVQEKNKIIISKENIKCVSNTKCSKKELDDLIFSYKVCKHIKSNAIVLSKNKKTIGIGIGQTSRVGSLKLAISKIVNRSKKLSFVAASDAFFPFTDSIEILARNKCRAIIQAKGSINDNKIIKYANNKNIPLYFTNYRFFKH